ncbi:hypothetical protein E2320_008365, partial [Naja naja]
RRRATRRRKPFKSDRSQTLVTQSPVRTQGAVPLEVAWVIEARPLLPLDWCVRKGRGQKAVNRGAEGFEYPFWRQRSVSPFRYQFSGRELDFLTTSPNQSSTAAGNFDCVSQTLALAAKISGSRRSHPDHKHGLRLRSSESGARFLRSRVFASALGCIDILLLLPSRPNQQGEGLPVIEKRRVVAEVASSSTVVGR